MARLLTLIRIVIGSLMLAAVVINFSNVVGRYAFSKPIFWADEAMVFIQIWCVLLGAALVTHENAHLRMDAFEHLAPPRFKRWFESFTVIVTIGVALILTWVSTGIVVGMIDTDQRAIALEIPMAIPYAALPLGFFLIALIAALRLADRIRGDTTAEAPSSDREQS